MRENVAARGPAEVTWWVRSATPTYTVADQRSTSFSVINVSA